MGDINPIKLVVVDDHTIVRRGVVELLNSLGGYSILFEASDGMELLQRMKNAKILPDLCILDISMPNMNGYETAKRMTADYHSVKLLALSMFTTEVAIIKMLRSGASGFLPKESDPTELDFAIKAIVEKGFYHSELVSNKLLSAMTCEDKESPHNLSAIEIEFLRNCCLELTYGEIAKKMNTSPRTIEGYREHLSRKLNIKSRTGLAMFALRSGLAELSLC